MEEYNGWNFYHFNDALEDYRKIKVSDSFIYILLTSKGIESPHKYKVKKKNIHTIEEANEYLKEVFIPKYNARFALPIDNTKNHFISSQKDFNYNIELAIWSEHKIDYNSYLKYNKQYHIITENNQKVYIPTSKKIKVYKFLGGTEHILYNDKFYELKTVNEYQIQISKLIVVSLKSKKIINTSKAHSPSNSPWRKGLPPLVTNKSMHYAVMHGC